jgi:SAM-dependent methyltransferase
MMFDAELRSATLAGRTLLRPRLRRDTPDVEKEYSDNWNWYREQLEKSQTLDSWLCLEGICNALEWRNVRGKLVCSREHVGDFYRRSVFDAVQRNFPNAQSITEFGCGVGRNLLYMKRLMPHAQVYGYELCQEGVDVARAAAVKFDIDVKYERLDYLTMSAGGALFPPTDVAFTCFSLEQLPRGIDLALANILGRCKMGSVHLEPVPENYPFTFRGVVGRIDHWKAGYLRNFDAAAKRSRAQAVEKRTMDTAHNPLMFPSLYVLKIA